MDDKARLLIIDDDEQVRNLLRDLLSEEYRSQVVSSAEEALKVLETAEVDLVISDIEMAGLSGLELVPLILEKDRDIVVIMISGRQTIDYAIEAMRAGAFDYVTKPLDIAQVEAAVARALKHQKLLADKRRYENHLEELVRDRTAEIERLAFHDRLTSLPNRELFLKKCEDVLLESQRHGRTGAVLLVSLDRFKRITDTLGHASGDVLVTSAARRMQSCLRAGDLLARFDTAEFALLLPDVNSRDLEHFVTTIAELMKPEFRLDNRQEIFATASLGSAIFPANGDNASSVVQNAGVALELAREHGGNNHQRYITEMNANALSSLGLETNLRRAVEANEFVTYFQPIVDLASGRPVGYEALVRWQHPRLGLLAPGDFISLAEDTGLILDIGASVMKSACTQTVRWRQLGAPLRIAINVSPRQFRDPGFLDGLVKVLRETRLEAQWVELEITETTIIENFESARQMLSALRELGVKISIDDFGTGYSSLSYLKHLPIDRIKLDRSFVAGATSDPRDAALVMAVISLAHNLDLRVIAEGIETEAQRDFLRLLRCDEGQGYLFGQPAPAELLGQPHQESRPDGPAHTGSRIDPPQRALANE